MPHKQVKTPQNLSIICWKFIPCKQVKKTPQNSSILHQKFISWKFISNSYLLNSYLYSWKFHFHELNGWKTSPMGPTVMFDLFVGYDQHALAEWSWDLTTFQTPLGMYRLTSIPMGYTNSMQIFYGDTMFLLQEEIPHVTIYLLMIYPWRGHYQVWEGRWTIPENEGIWCFMWDRLQNVNQVIQRIKHVGGTFSGHKMHVCVGSAVVIGHKCTYEGWLPDESRVQKILDWPVCQNLTEVLNFTLPHLVCVDSTQTPSCPHGVLAQS